MGDRFTAAKLNPALAQPGHDRPLSPQAKRPVVRRLHFDCCHSSGAPSVLSKVRGEGRARSRVVAGDDAQPLDKKVHFVFSDRRFCSLSLCETKGYSLLARPDLRSRSATPSAV